MKLVEIKYKMKFVGDHNVYAYFNDAETSVAIKASLKRLSSRRRQTLLSLNPRLRKVLLPKQRCRTSSAESGSPKCPILKI